MFPSSFNPNFVDLSTCALVRNNIPFGLHNIYQHQNWKYL